MQVLANPCDHIVTHGLMSRIFLMKWYHFSVEYFEDLRNVNHCEFLIMRKQEETGKYVLENKLRTWSQLRQERALLKEKEKDKEGENVQVGKDRAKVGRAASTPTTRRWGGCPNGCNHGKNFKIRPDLAELVRTSDKLSEKATRVMSSATGEALSATLSACHDSDTASTSALENGGAARSTTIAPSTSPMGLDAAARPIFARRPAAKRFQSFISDAGQECIDTDRDVDSSEVDNPHQRLVHGPQMDVSRARGEVVSSPDGTPSHISLDARLLCATSPPAANGIPPTTPTTNKVSDGASLGHGSDHVPALQLDVGHDFGGTYSGHAGQTGSSDETRIGMTDHAFNDSVNKTARLLAITKMKQNAAAALAAAHNDESSSNDEPGMANGAKARRLGGLHQGSDVDADADDEGDEELAQAERDDKSIQKSVY